MAAAALLRSVMAEDWRLEQAASQLLTAVAGDRRVLALIRARLSRTMLERPTRITERADATLDHALSTAGDHRGQAFVGIPCQAGRDA